MSKRWRVSKYNVKFFSLYWKGQKWYSIILRQFIFTCFWANRLRMFWHQSCVMKESTLLSTTSVCQHTWLNTFRNATHTLTWTLYINKGVPQHLMDEDLNKGLYKFTWNEDMLLVCFSDKENIYVLTTHYKEKRFLVGDQMIG